MKPTKPYVVKYGDWLAKIAEEHGTTVHEIRSHPNNAEHVRQRPDPNKIYPGDVIHIPYDPQPVEPPVPSTPPGLPRGRSRRPPWPYVPPPGAVPPPKPTWECPEGICVCHPTSGPDATEFSVLLCDHAGRRMGGARCRILVGGREINEEMPYANEHGWVTARQRKVPESVLVEWAPADTPLEPRYPYRNRCIVDFSQIGSRREEDLARLANVGFSLGHDEGERIRRFQREYRYTAITGELDHIRPELESYHDHTRLPQTASPPAVAVPAEVVVPQAVTTPARPVPTVAPHESAPEPPTLGFPKGGGAQVPGQLTAAPQRFPDLVVALRARFAHDDALTSRWADDRHLHSMRHAAVTLDIASLSLELTGHDPDGNTPFHNADGVTKIIDLEALHDAGPTSNVEGVLTITASAAHRLPRAASAIHVPVGPSDKNATLTPHHCLLRDVKVGVVLRPSGELSAASNSSETEDAIVGGTVVTSCRAAPKGIGNVCLVDWRPDFIQSRSTTKKSTETVTTHLQAGTEVTTLAEDELIVIHQTETTGRATIGNTLNHFTDTSSGKDTSAHYVIDTDGFTVKMANEDVRCVHASGDRGSAWRGLVSRNDNATREGLLPARNIKAFNNITIGIEHVHGAASTKVVTTFPKAQMDASLRLLLLLRPGRLLELGGVDDIVGHNQIGIARANELGTKPNCPGTGYDWKRLEDEKIARKTRFQYTFKSAADQAVEAYIAKNGVIDASADGLGHTRHLQTALRTCGYFVARANQLTDTYDDATRAALVAFVLRHFGGPQRANLRARVLNIGVTVEPVVNELLVMTLLASAEDA